LFIALTALGIELEADEGKIHRPTRIRWRRTDFHEMPPLSTNNLYYVPGGADGRAVLASDLSSTKPATKPQ
jgi:hypothetical protein